MRVLVVWFHVLAAAAWVGGLLYAGHLVVPAVTRGERAGLVFLTRGRTVAWAAVIVLVGTGLVNLSHARLDSPWLLAKVLLILLVIPIAAHRDFAALPRAVHAIDEGAPAAPALAAVRRLDRLVLALALAAMLLGVGISRGH
jgi:uncharacterized membrane protein